MKKASGNQKPNRRHNKRPAGRHGRETGNTSRSPSFFMGKIRNRRRGRQGILRESSSSAKQIVEVVFEREDNHPFTAVRFDVGEQARDFDSGDGGYLAAEAFPSLGDKVLPHAFDHVHALGVLGELTFGRSQDAFETHQNHVAQDERLDLRGSAPHEFLFEFDDGIADSRLSLTLGQAVLHGRKDFLLVKDFVHS